MQFYRQGIQLYKQGKYQQAIKLFSRSLSKQPDNKNAFIYRGVAHNQLKQHQQALSDYQSALSIDPKFALAHFNKGIIYLSTNQYHDAVKQYTQTIQQQPSFAKAHYNRGLAYASMNNHQEAIANFSEAVKLDPQFGSAYYKRGLSQQRLKNYDDALADYSESIAINRNYVQGYSSRGLLLMQLKKNKDAENDLNIALQISPNNPAHYFNLAKFYIVNGPEKNARECFEGGVGIFSKKGQPFYREKFSFPEDRIGIYRKVRDDYHEIQQEIKQLHSLNPFDHNKPSKQLSQISSRHLKISILKATSPTSPSPDSKNYELQLKIIRDELNQYRLKMSQLESPHEKVRRRNADRFNRGVETITQQPDQASNINESRYFGTSKSIAADRSVKSSNTQKIERKELEYERKSYIKGQVTMEEAENNNMNRFSSDESGAALVKKNHQVQKTPSTQIEAEYKNRNTIESKGHDSSVAPRSGSNPAPAYSHVRLRDQGNDEPREERQKRGTCCCTGDCLIY